MKAGCVFLRLATKADVPKLFLLVKELAKFEKQMDIFAASEEALSSTLFNLPPLQGPTVLLLEVGENSETAMDPSEGLKRTDEKVEVVANPVFLEDPRASQFVSAYNSNRVMVGYAQFFPNYSTFLAKKGYYLGDLFVREAYRMQGYGTKLLRRVAQISLEQGAGRLEWLVLDWNEKAIQFYTKKMGADLMEEWRICRFTGSNLVAAGSCFLHD